MNDTISRGLELLASGLRPYVAVRAASIHLNERVLSDIERGDAQFLLVFMWDRWNELFRDDLSFVERSLISELRDFRNRWAHQGKLMELDTYRILDDIERLLHAINSDQTPRASEMRRESLNRLWQTEIGRNDSSWALRIFSPFLLCMASAVAISFALLHFLSSPWDGILSVLVLVGMFRLAWHQSLRESVSLAGPKECGHCGKIIYTIECPYCHPTKLAAAPERGSESREVNVGNSIIGWLPGFGFPRGTSGSIKSDSK
ncbi:MAG: Swt1 family HEPN domain-containing protein [Planctomycetota bacterium]|nr:Swt1 family HEPN domain-containing protein [Planctomycetota bacterium]